MKCVTAVLTLISKHREKNTYVCVCLFMVGEMCIYSSWSVTRKKLKSHKINIVSYLQSKKYVNLNCSRQDSSILRSAMHRKAICCLALLVKAKHILFRGSNSLGLWFASLSLCQIASCFLCVKHARRICHMDTFLLLSET